MQLLQIQSRVAYSIVTIKKILFFLQFLLLGIGLGIVEDVIAVYFVTGEPITLKVIQIITLVAIPFAAFGELVVDRVDIPFIGRKTEILLEFFIFGVLMGITEDVIAIFAATGEPITMTVVVIATLVAIPFAVFSELIVDRLDFLKEK